MPENAEARAAEQARAEEFAVFEAKAQQWVPCILQPGEYDEMTRRPTIEVGEFCTLYLVESADGAEGNEYDEFIWVPDAGKPAGGHFEKLGASSVEFPAATEADVEGILDGSVTQGGAGITVTAMAAIKAGMDAAHAPAGHGHEVADVEGLRAELDGLDGRIAALPTFAEVDAKVGTGADGEKVDSADVKGVPGKGGYLDVYARKGDDALMLRAFGSGLLQMVGFDEDGYDAEWELSAGNLLSDVRGSATDLSYAALRALKPGCYLVPSTAANQPTSGQGDGNMLVGRVSTNRVWAVVAYNTGAVYCAYGYEHQGSTANFGWRRVDNAEPALPRTNRGMLTDLSWAAIYSLAQTAPGTYLVANNATGGPYSGQYGNLFLAVSGGNRVVAIVAYDNGPVFATYASDAAHWTRIDNGAVTLSSLGAAASRHNHSASAITSGTLPIARGGTGATTAAAARNALGLGNTSGAVPVANGGTGATTAANARKNLGVPALSGGTWYLRVNSTAVCGGYLDFGDSLAQGYYDKQATFPVTYKSAPQVVVSDYTMHGAKEYGGWTGVSAHSATATGFTARFYNASGGPCDFNACWMAIGTV